jgi:hypothetical protein
MTLRALLLASLLLPAPAAAAPPAAPPDHPLFPRDLEIELALNAAPPHLRDGAAVWVLDAAGYVKARDGKNAFSCIVSRRGGDLFPVCWDAEGARALMPIDVKDGAMRLAGTANADIEREIAAGFKDGRYRAPAKAGVAYMLSPLRYKIDESGAVTRANPNPHVMFYGPGLTDADVGGVRGSVLFMNKVGPDGMIIVPVGQKERETILADSRSLTERVERLIGYKAPVPAVQPAAAAPAAAAATKVIAIAKRGPGTPGQSLQDLLPQEVRDTVSLYLDGKIEQWFMQQDGAGPVFLMNSRSVEDARAQMAQLPLVKARMLEFDFIAVGPLSPLRVLLQPQK